MVKSFRSNKKMEKGGAMIDILVGYLIYWLFGGEYAARQKGVKVGTGCRILTHSFSSEPWLISIGDRVTITSGVKFLTHDGATWLMRDENGRRYRYAPIEIGNDVFIGANTILLPGVKIGNQVIIGAGSIVTKSIPGGVIASGNPARIIGYYEDYRKKALIIYPSSRDMIGSTYRERIDSVVEKNFRPDLQ